MRQVVRDRFFSFTVQREGWTPFMYCDTLNLVTTGVGNLIDAGPNHGGPSSAVRAALNNVVSEAAMAPAMALPWRIKGEGWTFKRNDPNFPIGPLGRLASRSEIAEAWTITKRQNAKVPNFAQNGGFAYQNLTKVSLSNADMKALFERTMNSFDATLARSFAGYESYPAAAQFAMMSMAWAMGPGFGTTFKSFKAAMESGDFKAAAEHSFFKGGGGTPDNRTGRNRENREALLFAVDNGGDALPPFLQSVVAFAAGASSQTAPLTPVQTAQGGITSALMFAGLLGGLGALTYGSYEYARSNPRIQKFINKWVKR